MLPPFEWRVSSARRRWLLAIAAVAGGAIWLSNLATALQCALCLLVAGVTWRAWRERGPKHIALRDGYLWLDQQPFALAAVSRIHKPCWVLDLVDSAGRSQQLLLWPDSLAAEDLRQLRVALATQQLQQY